MTGPLSPYRIVDLTSMVSGPYATQLLCDQGADVIKVETLGGDLMRHAGSARGGMSAAFLANNRGKRSIALDLKQERGMAILRRLVGTADVFVQNFRPGAAERMGLGEDSVRGLRPDIVYVSISGFGEAGPYVHKRVYDPVIQALSGVMGHAGRPGGAAVHEDDPARQADRGDGRAGGSRPPCSAVSTRGRATTCGSRCSTSRWPGCGPTASSTTP